MSTAHEPETDPFDLLSAELIAAFDAWTPGSPSWDEGELDEWARRAFRLQFEGNRAYGRYCEARGVGPGDVNGWRDVVPVPTEAFRVVDLVVGSVSAGNLTFLTSGTTRGRSAEGRHLVRSPELYRASLRAGFRAFVLPRNMLAKIVTLPPSFAHETGSSLGWMLDDVRAGLGSGDGVSVASSGGIDWALLDAEVRESGQSGRPLCILGTTVGLASWLDRLEDGRSPAAQLPEGSTLMDTGGEKGRPGLQRSSVVRGAVPGAFTGRGSQRVRNDRASVAAVRLRLPAIPPRRTSLATVESPGSADAGGAPGRPRGHTLPLRSC